MMKSIRGTYENGTIKLLDPVDLENETNVVITFLDDEFPFSTIPAAPQPSSNKQDSEAVLDKDEQSEEYYEKLRKHKRYKAKGNITIVQDGEESIYPLNDYSAGGLSFLADKVFDIGTNINAALKYNASGEILVMDFEIAVRGVFEEETDRYKIGCQFIDNVDEELWHTIMGQ
ncbi:MAG: PilZ domain-containing protein [Proteobacteria bacterium]|nr:PilZ domain-containing protein [Pseudomonadota bacterium]